MSKAMRGSVVGIVSGGLLSVISASAVAQTPRPSAQLAIEAAHRDAVFIAKDDFVRAIDARARGSSTALSSLGAVRAGDDRINVDVIQRRGTGAEGPVSHRVVTEIYYVLDGGGDIETGGEIPDAKPLTTANGEPVNPANIGPSIRGEQIVGGTARHITKGDVVMIPPNVPHRFKSLDGSITYMVVRMNPGYEKGR
jgi:mannose-6-phosphate isomerase-like protein (cupin superfamily)